jgi:RND family efflux transporter MFP subunit
MNWRIAYAGALLISVAFFTGCGGHGERQRPSAAQLPTVQVRVQVAQARKQAATMEVAGTVRAKLRSTLEAKVSGRIEEMPVLLGQRIKQGQRVALLDAAEIKARVDQAQASLEQAQSDWARISALFENQAVTRAEYDAAQARQRVTKAAVAEAEAMLRYVEVIAPFDAVVTRKLADVGDLATPGKPLIEIEDPAELQLDADVPESLASRIEPEGQLTVRVEALGSEIQGKVAEIAPAADSASRTFRVKVDLPGIPGARSGQFARLLIPDHETAVVHVPASAVVQRGQLEIAFVVTNRVAQLQLVRTGKRTGDEVEILSGLNPGDPIVVESAALLTDGQPVEAK